MCPRAVSSFASILFQTVSSFFWFRLSKIDSVIVEKQDLEESILFSRILWKEFLLFVFLRKEGRREADSTGETSTCRKTLLGVSSLVTLQQHIVTYKVHIMKSSPTPHERKFERFKSVVLCCGFIAVLGCTVVGWTFWIIAPNR